MNSNLSVVNTSQRKTPFKVFRLNFQEQSLELGGSIPIINNTENQDDFETPKLGDMNSSLCSENNGNNSSEMQSEQLSFQNKKLRLRIRRNSLRNSGDHCRILQPINTNVIALRQGPATLTSNFHFSAKQLKENCRRKMQLADSCYHENQKLRNDITSEEIHANHFPIFLQTRNSKKLNVNEVEESENIQGERNDCSKANKARGHILEGRKKSVDQHNASVEIVNSSITTSAVVERSLGRDFSSHSKGEKARVEAFFWDSDISSTNDKSLIKSPSFSQKDVFILDNLQNSQGSQNISQVEQHSSKREETKVKAIKYKIENSEMPEARKFSKTNLNSSFSIGQKDKCTFEQAIDFDIHTFKELIYRTNVRKNAVGRKSPQQSGNEGNPGQSITKIELLRPKSISNSRIRENNERNKHNTTAPISEEANWSTLYNEAKSNEVAHKMHSRELSPNHLLIACKNEKAIPTQVDSNINNFLKIHQDKTPGNCSIVENSTSSLKYQPVQPVSSILDGSFGGLESHPLNDTGEQISGASAEEKLKNFSTQMRCKEDKLGSIIEKLYNTTEEDVGCVKRQFFIDKATEAVVHTVQLKFNNKDLQSMSDEIRNLEEIVKEFNEVSAQIHTREDWKQLAKVLIEILKEVLDLAHFKREILVDRPVKKAPPIRSRSCGQKDQWQESLHIATEGCIQTQPLNLQVLCRSTHNSEFFPTCSIPRSRKHISESVITEPSLFVKDSSTQDDREIRQNIPDRTNASYEIFSENDLMSFSQPLRSTNAALQNNDKNETIKKTYEDFRASFIQLALLIRKEYEPDHPCHSILISDLVENAYQYKVNSKNFEKFIREKFNTFNGNMKEIEM